MKWGINSKFLSNIFQTSMIVLICLSCVMLVMHTEQKIYQKFSSIFFLVELISSSIFAAEYLYRIHRSLFLGANKNYIFSFMGIIDLLSFLPFFLLLSHLLNAPGILQLQLCRLIKLTRYFPAFNMLADVLHYESESLIVSVVLMFIVVIFASVGIYVFEHNIQPDVFGSIPRAMWWAIVTLTTVGYGDVTPITPAGKIFATFITLAGVGLVSLPAGIIASGFTEQLRIRRKRFEMKVEQLLDDDGKLSNADLSKLEEDRKILGLNKEGADLIISEIQRSASKK